MDVVVFVAVGGDVVESDAADGDENDAVSVL